MMAAGARAAIFIFQAIQWRKQQKQTNKNLIPPFKKDFQKSYIIPSAIEHCPNLSHIVTASSEGGWEMHNFNREQYNLIPSAEK